MVCSHLRTFLQVQLMQIQKIKALGKHRHVVYFISDGEELTMPLYLGELRRYHVKEEAELPDSVYEEICTQILNKRAVARSEYLLARKNYTVSELTKKLSEGYYPASVIGYVLSVLAEYGMIDDERYAERYVEVHGRRKSIRQLRMELTGKGIDREIIDSVLEDTKEQEANALAQLMERRCRNADLSDEKEWNRQLRYFIGKGFAFDEVKQELMQHRDE